MDQERHSSPATWRVDLDQATGCPSATLIGSTRSLRCASRSKPAQKPARTRCFHVPTKRALSERVGAAPRSAWRRRGGRRGRSGTVDGVLVPLAGVRQRLARVQRQTIVARITSPVRFPNDPRSEIANLTFDASPILPRGRPRGITNEFLRSKENAIAQSLSTSTANAGLMPPARPSPCESYVRGPILPTNVDGNAALIRRRAISCSRI